MHLRNLSIVFVCLAITGCNHTGDKVNSPAGAIKDGLRRGCDFNATLESAFELADIFEIVVPYGDKFRKAVKLVCDKVNAGAKAGTVEITVKKSGKLKTIVLERE